MVDRTIFFRKNKDIKKIKNSHQYDVLYEKINDLKNQITKLENQIIKLGEAMENLEQNVRVSKTSFQFGIFLNNQKANDNFDNYIQYKSVKNSNNDEVDLALLKPVNPNDVIGKIKITDMSKIDSISVIAPKITQKMMMICYRISIYFHRDKTSNYRKEY